MVKHITLAEAQAQQMLNALRSMAQTKPQPVNKGEE